ncbi:S-adenosyl-L-methionine-dependent methyltransferase [Lindgomyces ingoldianus]|uniref:S-adenosyl-L-methionine-dependent methyltransferase n=1 Tax=Lindgomyces ingoldianus TaxID=673940 RepID=A0ACB6RA38_9PLEO|nr:S-adenosyl-L-methionine-dependent methyltransferase [Lindgomyces ingoldianus]KAF2475192.1 S-adenosyl-L-methionine-dependent methyltransferase [Lindgomyces ingoldianus]
MDLKPTLSSLGSRIKELAESLERHLRENGVEAPTLAADSPINISKFTPEIFTIKQQLADALNDLSIISQGPSESVFNYAHNAIPDVAALNVLNHFNFWSAVPLEGSASITDIAKYTSLPEEAVQRVVEHGMMLRFFAYTDPSTPKTSHIQHTSRSAALAQSSGLRALVHSCIQECGPPMMVMPEALEKYSLRKPTLTRDIRETAFALSHSGGAVFGNFSTVWDFLENDGEGEKKGWRQRSFNTWMTYINDIFRMNEVLLEALDWKAAGDVTVVDIGGSGGHDTFALASAYPNLNIIVEDLRECKPIFENNVLEHLKSRVAFREHNFFNPQPVQADIYILKFIFHDWPDKECIAILQALRPALKAGAKVLFIDYIGKDGEFDPTLPRSIRQLGTSTDLRMMALFNGRERPVDTWTEIFRAADERFEVASVKANALTYILVIEAIWRGK